uniref:SRS domain-containing protein n=1 Tax=Neospora caninum (strain Liverpool) TaxID=572307 RepID=F0JAY4_NEOCL|nr:SRS domain-containing protein [Neospora caninum Liverpool]CEL71250.1 TPA: SRS domain-containing protein [Neospora caninum Liverpool]
MAPSSRVTCPVFDATGTMSHFPRRIGFRMGLRVILVFVSAFLLLDSLPFSGCVRALAAEPTDPACATTGAATKCTCTNDQPSEKDLTATLSQEENVLEIVCKQESQQCAPEQLNGNLVCPSSTTNLKDCKTTKGTDTPFNINTLLSGSSPTVSWEDCDSDSECTTKKLTIPPENFPSVDQKFMVGCVKDDDATDTMKVTVTLEARASATEEQTVTCAYGQNSNPTHQTVTLTPEKNSFTLVCGNEGEVLPTNYKEEYCVSETAKEASGSCTGAYEGIFPGYETTWWAATTGPKGYKFTIPDDQFPAEEQKITVGCQKQTAGENEQKRQGNGREKEAKSTVCSVDVTIVASAASSAAFVSGTAVMLLSLVGIFSSTL